MKKCNLCTSIDIIIMRPKLIRIAVKKIFVLILFSPSEQNKLVNLVFNYTIPPSHEFLAPSFLQSDHTYFI